MDKIENLDLRDYFAAKAMQQLIIIHQSDSENEMLDYNVAMFAYIMADAMLKVRGE